MRKYMTVQGDTWDLIAMKMYPDLGGEKFTTELIAANPKYVETVIFSAGIELNVPEVAVPASRLLPPWM